MNRAFYSATSRAQKAARRISLWRFARAGALLATPIVLALSLAACSGNGTATLISIAVTPATISIGAGGAQQFTATGTYSNGNTQNVTTSVTWTSGTKAAATISTGGLATGVAAGSSMITACAPGIAGITVTGTALLNVTGTPTLQSITVTPAAVTIGVGATQQYTATGTYSDGSMKTLTTETWDSSETSIATISATGLATTVAAGSTTITASCNEISGTTPLTVSAATLLSIAVTPAGATIPAGGTEQYTATGTYSDGTMGTLPTEIWSSSNTSIAAISSTGLATAVAVGTTTITATCGDVTGNTTLTVSSSSLNSLLNGQYALLLRGRDGVGGATFDYSFAASITADGSGNITTGEMDFADGNSTASHDMSITGTYGIGPDGRGTITLSTSDTYFGVGSVTTLGVSMTSDMQGLIIEEDAFATGSGIITFQNTNSFSAANINGGYAFAFSGVDESNTGAGINAAGAFTADGVGSFANGVQDVVTGAMANNGPIAGTFTAPDGNGRGTATLNSTGMYAYYSAGGNTLFFIEIDERTLLAGSVVTQASSPSLPSGSYAFAGGGTDYGSGGLPLAMGGLFTSDGVTSISSGTLDFNDAGNIFTDQPICGGWTIGSSGRGVITITGAPDNISQFAFYPTANNGIFMLEIDGATTALQSSEAVLEQSGSFSAASLTGPYAVNYTGVPLTAAGVVEQDLVGELTSNGAGDLTGLADINVFTNAGAVTTGGTFAGNYITADATGRYAGTLTYSNSTQSVEFYAAGAASPNTALFISLDLAQVNAGVMESQTLDSTPRQAGRKLRVPLAHLIGPRTLLRAGHNDAAPVPAK
jgi:hypothetical protein